MNDASHERTSAPLPVPGREAVGGGRLRSLDALRGFDMFWIVGGAAVVSALGTASEGSLMGVLRTQLTHVDWEGFRFYDLIFPLFIFISGVSAVFSLDRARARGGVPAAARRIVLRTLLLFLIGVVYSGGISRGWDEIRWLGVLQRIGLSYGAAALLYLFVPLRGLLAVTAGLLLGYWALLLAVPVRDISLDGGDGAARLEATGRTNAKELYLHTEGRVRGVYDKGRNLPNHLDFLYLPGRKWNGYWDPEGLLSTVPAVGTALLGVFAGCILRREDLLPRRRLLWLAGAGLFCLGTGLAWGLWFPVIKKIWTSSYVLVAGGWSFLLLALFHWWIDLRGRTWGTEPFVWIGTNALTLYLAANILGASGGFQGIAARVLGGAVKDAAGAFGPALVTCGGLLLMFLLARFLHRREIFIRL